MNVGVLWYEDRELKRRLKEKGTGIDGGIEDWLKDEKKMLER